MVRLWKPLIELGSQHTPRLGTPQLYYSSSEHVHALDLRGSLLCFPTPPYCPTRALLIRYVTLRSSIPCIPPSTPFHLTALTSIRAHDNLPHPQPLHISYVPTFPRSSSTDNKEKLSALIPHLLAPRPPPFLSPTCRTLHFPVFFPARTARSSSLLFWSYVMSPSPSPLSKKHELQQSRLPFVLFYFGSSRLKSLDAFDLFCAYVLDLNLRLWTRQLLPPTGEQPSLERSLH